MQIPAPSTSAERALVWGTYAVSAVLLALLWEPIVLARIAADRQHNFDLGIYGQAIYRLSWNDPNPWLSLRDCKVFNDHLDPILWVAAPVAKFIEPAYAGTLVELAIVLASPLALVWLWRRDYLDACSTALSTAYLLHDRATLLAIQFPFHPTTWAMLPAAFLAAALLLDKRRAVLLWLVLLFVCKEEFPFVGLMAAGVYLARREFRFGGVVAALSIAWLIAAFWLRPLLVGEIQHHVSNRLYDADGLWATLVRGWQRTQWRHLGRLFLPLLPLIGYLLWRRERTPLWLWTLLIPLVAIRFLAGAWLNHYLPPLMPIVLLGLLPAGVGRRLPPAVLACCLLVLALLNAGYWNRMANDAWQPDSSGRRPWQTQRMASIEAAREYLLAHPDGKALVQGNLLPRLVRRPNVFQVAGSQDPAARAFDYVLIEKPPQGDFFPLTREDYEKLLQVWRATLGARAILDDDHVFLAEGEFQDMLGRH